MPSLVSRISSSDFLEISNSSDSDESQRLSSYHNPWTTSSSDSDEEDPDDCFEEFTGLSVIPAPIDSKVSLFKKSSASLVSSPASIRSCKPVYSKYDLNWTSIDDYLDHWDILPTSDQYKLRSLVMSDTSSNCYRFGLKTKNLETHLLLSVGCDLTSILGSKEDAVLSNLKSLASGYSSKCVDNRTVDPKTCYRAASKFKKERNVEILFKKRFVAYQAVISSGDSYRSLGRDRDATRARYMDFFRLNSESLAFLLKKKEIVAYSYSHEISVDSILNHKYRPHTHMIVFMENPGYDLESQREKIDQLEAKFNSTLVDRKMSFVRSEVDYDMVPKVARKYSEIEKSFGYFFKAYSLSDQYMREIREDNIQTLNKATVECYRDLVWLFKPDRADKGRCVRRFRSSMIPKFEKKEVLEEETLPLLQKETKSSKIKKANKIFQEHSEHESTNSISCSQENPETSKSNSSGIHIKKLPGRAVEHPLREQTICRHKSNTHRSSELSHRYRRLHDRGRQTHVPGYSKTRDFNPASSSQEAVIALYCPSKNTQGEKDKRHCASRRRSQGSRKLSSNSIQRRVTGHAQISRQTSISEL